MIKQKIVIRLLALVVGGFYGGAQAYAAVHALGDLDPDTVPFLNTGADFDKNARGWRFKATVDGLQVTELGIAPVTDNSTYLLSLWDFANETLLGQVSVDYTLADGNWKWAPLSTSVSLQKDKDYVVMGASDTEGAKYYFKNNLLTTSPWTPSGAIDYIETRFCNDCESSIFPAEKLPGNHQYGVVDIGYTQNPSSVVPLPSTVWMFGAGLWVLLKRKPAPNQR